MQYPIPVSVKNLLDQNQIKKLLKEFPGATRAMLRSIGYERKLGVEIDSAITFLIKKKEITYSVDKRKPGDHHRGNRPRKYYLVE